MRQGNRFFSIKTINTIQVRRNTDKDGNTKYYTVFNLITAQQFIGTMEDKNKPLKCSMIYSRYEQDDEKDTTEGDFLITVHINMGNVAQMRKDSDGDMYFKFDNSDWVIVKTPLYKREEVVNSDSDVIHF